MWCYGENSEKKSSAVNREKTKNFFTRFFIRTNHIRTSGLQNGLLQIIRKLRTAVKNIQRLKKTNKKSSEASLNCNVFIKKKLVLSNCLDEEDNNFLVYSKNKRNEI